MENLLVQHNLRFREENFKKTSRTIRENYTFLVTKLQVIKSLFLASVDIEYPKETIALPLI